MTDFALVAERPSDLMTCVTFAAPLRRAGHMCATPLAFAKPKKQLERARALDPSWIVILNGDVAIILDPVSQGRFETTLADAQEALLELWANCHIGDPENATAKTIHEHFLEWMRK